MTETKVDKTLATKLQRISVRSVTDPAAKFGKLMPLFTKENLTQCFCELKENRAVGIDRKSKEEYGANLEANIGDLVGRMKAFQYRPLPVREVFIPKDDGGKRPLGISTVEDKIVQLMYAKVLEAIYEPLFLDCSYGFRPRRNCHQAIQAVHSYLFRHPCPVVIDADLKNYFGTINHESLIDFLSKRIDDKAFLRYLVRMLKAGILGNEGFRVTDEGSPQGAICSPVLSNVFAHYVIDEWVELSVKPRCPGTELMRYADDLVMCCPDKDTALRIHEVLGKRMQRYGLSLHATKTKIVELDKAAQARGSTKEPLTSLVSRHISAALGRVKSYLKSALIGRNFAVSLPR